MSAETEQAADPGERGGLRINRAVLRKIAEYAAEQDPGCARPRRWVTGVGLAEHGVTARLSGPDDALRIRLDVALRYPTPVRGTTDSMRERISGELQRIAGCQVRAIDVTVSALVPADASPRLE